MTRKHLLALAALIPAAVLAQADSEEPGAGAAADDGSVATSPERGAAGAGGSAEAPPVDTSVSFSDASTAPDTYTVKPGDTLWDLSGRFLNNPWYWPKVWSNNPEITNPHWIYPGNLLRFYRSAEEAPARVEPMVAEEPESPKELEDFSRAEEEDAVGVAGPYKIGYVPPRQRLARHDTFVTPRELAESGSIEAAFAEKLMLASLDRAYARFENAAKVKPGETYVVYKTVRPIYHPVTHELFGYQSTVLGSAKVVAVDERAATLVISQSLEPIERGALLGPWTDKIVRPIERKPNRVALKGRIIASQVDVVTQVGEHHVVFVDRGAKDGVEEGNVFTVVRSGDLSRRDPRVAPWDPNLPPEDVGNLLVIDVKERASTALVTRSLAELLVGDHVEMKLGSTGSAGK